MADSVRSPTTATTSPSLLEEIGEALTPFTLFGAGQAAGKALNAAGKALEKTGEVIGKVKAAHDAFQAGIDVSKMSPDDRKAFFECMNSPSVIIDYGRVKAGLCLPSPHFKKLLSGPFIKSLRDYKNGIKGAETPPSNTPPPPEKTVPAPKKADEENHRAEGFRKGGCGSKRRGPSTNEGSHDTKKKPPATTKSKALPAKATRAAGMAQRTEGLPEKDPAPRYYTKDTVVGILQRRYENVLMNRQTFTLKGKMTMTVDNRNGKIRSVKFSELKASGCENKKVTAMLQGITKIILRDVRMAKLDGMNGEKFVDLEMPLNFTPES